MSLPDLSPILHAASGRSVVYSMARVDSVTRTKVRLSPVADGFGLGDQIAFPRAGGETQGEIVERIGDVATALLEGPPEAVSVGDPVICTGPVTLAPTEDWLGRIVDSKGRPLDRRPLLNGPMRHELQALPRLCAR